jgi:ribonuclease HI
MNIGNVSKGRKLQICYANAFLASNNATEYEALLHGLRIAIALNIRRLRVLGASLLIINQPTKSGHVWMTR